jgi:molybdopterin-guanine dinucleotide biosynthesis protein A
MSFEGKDSIDGNGLVQGITGVILAGGKSSRFGKNKAFVKIGGVPLIEKIVVLLGSIFKQLVIVTNMPHEYSYLQIPLSEDIIKGLGPIGGVYTGLEVIEDGKGFFVACDMPFLNEKLIRYMVDAAESYDAVVPKIDWMIEPLHALYCKSCLPVLRELIDGGDYRISKSFETLSVRYVMEQEIKALDPQCKSFINVNRQEELNDVINSDKSNLKKS